MSNKPIYLQINFRDARIFEYSSEAKIGFDPHKNQEGVHKGYRRYYPDGLTGEFQGIKIQDSDWGKRLSVFVSDGDQLYVLQTGLLTAATDEVQEFAEHFITRLPNMEMGKIYRIYPYAVDQEDNPKYKNRGISIKLRDPKTDTMKDWHAVERAFHYQKRGEKLKKGMIPAIEWVENEVTGKKAKSASSKEAKLNFLGKVLKEELTRLKPTRSSSGATYNPGNMNRPAKAGTIAPVGNNITAETAKPKAAPTEDEAPTFPSADEVFADAPEGNVAKDDGLPF